MLFNEPKLLKFDLAPLPAAYTERFSALQRAEIAEIAQRLSALLLLARFSALQRAEIAEIRHCSLFDAEGFGSFSALQRAEIAEIRHVRA